MNILSLFDGMSCGQIALDRLGIKVDNYYASEIDKHAIKITQENYPNTIQLGDVRDIKGSNLPKIDLLIGGSPCQGFSFAGKQLNFEDERSKLFFEFVRLLKETNPKYFLLENVRMSKKYVCIISRYLGVDPIVINSNLVSAQSRLRYYWTNIPIEELPIDEGILLNDIMETDNINHLIVIDDINNIKEGSDYIFVPIDNHSSKTGLKCIGGLMRPTNKMWLEDGKLLSRNFSQGNRVYSSDGKSATLSANGGGLGGKTGLYEVNNVIRKLSRIECERLQTVPVGYTNIVSKSQALKALGNGWTVDIIKFILSSLISD